MILHLVHHQIVKFAKGLQLIACIMTNCFILLLKGFFTLKSSQLSNLGAPRLQLFCKDLSPNTIDPSRTAKYGHFQKDLACAKQTKMLICT